MTWLVLLTVARPGFPGMRWAAAGDWTWLVAFMGTFLVLLVGLLALAVFFQIRDRLNHESGSFRRRVT